MTVYVVQVGEYSDMSIEAIFSTREKAETYVAEEKRLSGKFGRHFNEIEEWVIDTVPETGGYRYVVEIDLASGGLSRIEAIYEYRHPLINATEATDRSIRVGSPISWEHAEKVAIEKRQEWLRSQRNPMR